MIVFTTLIVAIAVYAIIRGVDVRVALLVGALGLGVVTGQPTPVVKKLLVTLVDVRYVVPICTAMGFAQVLRYTECDQHLVHLLLRPLERVRGLLIPGAVLVGFLVNVPIISQTSTAVTVGSVLIPLLLASRISPATAGAALLLGSSLGGELLNAASPEIVSVSTTLKIDPAMCVARVFPLVAVQLFVTTALFWLLSLRAEAKCQRERGAANDPQGELPSFRISLLRAAVPLIPLAVLLAAQLLRHWVANLGHIELWLIGAAMLTGVAAAVLTTGRADRNAVNAFVRGACYAFLNIVAIIAIANAFGEGLRRAEVAARLDELIVAVPLLLVPCAGTVPLAFALLCGSGMAATQSVIEFFARPALDAGVDPAHVGAVVSIGAAAGRTMSPVAAVNVMCASISETTPLTLARRVVVPLLIGTAAVIALGMAIS